MTQDTKLQQLVINKLTTEQYNEAVEAGTIDENQLYMTTDAPNVTDVKVNGTSVVTNNTANINLGTMANESASDYSKKTVADTLYASKSLETTVSNHTSATNNPHSVTKAQVGLGNVDNTSDLDKPISTATQTALNGKVDKVSTANKVYGTDSNGNQTTYNADSFGKVDDVKVGTTSVVTNKIATLGTMAGETASNYSTKAVADTLYAEKALEATVATKVDKVSTANKVYGTNGSGGQTTYNVSDLTNTVTDVKVGTTSVVSNKIATLGTMAGENTTSYYTKTEVDGKLSGAMHFKGTKATVSELPSSGQQVGDMWNVTETGSNYAWDGSQWDKLSENIDLSGFYTKTESDDRFVNITGDETITGTKTFDNGTSQNRIIFQMSDVVLGETDVTAAHWTGYKTIDSEGTEFANCNSAYRVDGTTSNNFWVVNKKSDGTTVSGSLGIYATREGEVYAQGPTPSASSNTSSDVLTTIGWVNDPTKSTNVVHRSNAESISGNKTFNDATTLKNYINVTNTSEANIFIGNTSADVLGERSATEYIGSIKFRDKNNKEVFNIRGNLLTNGTQLNYNIRDYTDGTKHLQARLVSSLTHDGKAKITYNLDANGSGDTRTPVNQNLSEVSSGISDTAFALKGWVNNPATSTNVVHRTGDESITGTKAFLSDSTHYYVSVCNTAVDYSESPETNYYRGVVFSSAGMHELGFVRSCQSSNGNAYEMGIRGIDGNYNVMYLGRNNSGINYLNICQPTEDTTTSSQADTVGARNLKLANYSLDSNVVHKSGAETVAGTKTFTSNIIISKSAPEYSSKATNITRATAPESNQSSFIIKEIDNNNKGVCGLYRTYYTDGSGCVSLLCYKPQTTDSTYQTIKIGYNSAGNVYTYAPTPATSNSTSSTEITTIGWVNDPAKSTNVVHRTGNETIDGEKTFTSTIIAAPTNSNDVIAVCGKLKDTDVTVNEPVAGHGDYRFVDKNGLFAGGVYYEIVNSGRRNIEFRLKKKDTSNTALGIGESSNGTVYTYAPTPTEDTTSSTQIDTVGARNTKLQNYLQTSDQSDLLPNFDVMPVLQTIEFDTSDSNWHTILTRTNTETNAKDLNDILYFRVTVTGTGINHKIDYLVNFRGQLNYPVIISNNFPGTSDANYNGPRYIRAIYPKALNNGYNWSIEFSQNRNNNARHYKIEVFKTTSKVTWTQGIASIYNGTYHNSANWDVENTSGYWINWFNGSFNQSSWANNLNGQLSKFFNTNFPAGEALLINQFIYMNNNKHYPATNKTLAIEPGYGIQFTVSAYNANTDVGWDRIRQKQRITSLTNIPHSTLARGNPCYFRCTMDANGNILSDNYVDTSMGNGYTWYYVGVAESATAINIDTTQSFFITLDSNGNVTHINGKPIPQGTVTSVNNVAPVNGNVTLSIPAAQVNSDWNASSGVAQILNKPTVDQTYSGTSTNAQSGVAVKSAIEAAISSTYKPAGSVAFASLPTLAKSIEGNVYNVTDAFTTTADFVEGAGKSYPAGTNVVCINTSGTTYKWDVLAGFVDLSSYAIDSNVVHKTGDESITGNKTFSGNTTFSSMPFVKQSQPNIGIQYTGYTKGTAPSSTINGWFGTIFDKNGIAQSNKLAQIYHSLYSNGSSDISMALFTPTTGSTENNRIALCHNGTKYYTMCPHPVASGSTSATEIATVGWVNDPTKSTNVVHRTGDETIGGTKTFTTTVTRTGTLSNGGTYLISLTDSGGKGTISQVGYYVDSCLYNRLLASNSTSGKSGYIDIIVKDNGEYYSVINGTSGAINLSMTKTTSLTTDSTVPTMGWVNNPATSTNVVHRTGAETIAGVKTFSDNVNANTSVTVGQHAVMSYNSTTEALEFNFV